MSLGSRPAGGRTKRRQKQLGKIHKAIESLEARQLLAAHIVGSSTVYPTIQAAVDAASIGQTITVDPGQYNETVVVPTAQLTIKGAQAGVDGRSNLRGSNESTVTGGPTGTGTFGPGFRIIANDVSLDGFTVTGTTSISDATGAGIVIGPNQFGAHIVNNVVTNNPSGIFIANSSATDQLLIQHNAFTLNNVAGANTGVAIVTNGTISGGNITNVTIDSNVFLKNFGTTNLEPAIAFETQALTGQSNIRVTNNTFDNDGKAFLAYNINGLTITGNVVTECRDTTSGGLRFEGGCSNVTIQNNLIYQSETNGIRIDNKVSAGNNSAFTVTGNMVYGNGQGNAVHAGLIVNAGQFAGTIDATNNWWGASSGPSGDGTGTGDAIQLNGANGSFTPWATSRISDFQVPYYDGAQDVTAKMEAENPDFGGEGISYHDSDALNGPGRLHPYVGFDVDTSTDTDASTGYMLTNINAGEWEEYTITVPAAGTYTFNARVANTSTGSFHLELDGTNVSGAISMINTGGSSTWGTLSKTGINLSGGTHVLRLALDSGGFGNWNYFSFTPTSVTQPPAAPTGLLASASSASQINLTWTDNSSNETNFIIERKTGANGTYATLATVGANVTTYNDTTALSSTTYVYRIHATGAGGDSALSNEATATTPAAGSFVYLSDLSWSGTPTNGWGPVEKDTSNGSSNAGDGHTITLNGVTYTKGLGAHAISDVIYNITGSGYQSFLSDVGVDDETGASSSVIFQVFTTTNGVETKVFDSGVMGQTTATKSINVSVAGATQLRLHIDDAGDGNTDDHADWAGAKLTLGTGTAPAAPTGLLASASSASQINLTWTDNANNETGFIVERSSDGLNNWAQVGTPAQNATTFSNTGLSAGTQYFYRVRATNATGPSANSNVASATTQSQAGPVNYIAAGAVWKYLDDGSNQGTAWRAASFVDTAWKSGAAELGYGDGDEATVVSFGSNSSSKFITTYFRRSFSVADPTLVSALTLNLLRDDGAVVYLNGTEVYRNNMPTGTIAYNTLASTSIEDPANTYYSSSISPSLLVAGTNVIAVEVHQADVTSSDISFNFKLDGTVSQPATPPAAPSGLLASASSSSVQINLTWTDNATNESNFILERSPDGLNNWAQIATPAANASGYTDSTGLAQGTQYFYRIRATNSAGPSANSSVASATTASVPAAPTGLLASASSPSQINLTWTDNANNETSFKVERSLDGINNWTQIATPIANATGYSDSTGLSPNTKYYYRVTAINAIGPSSASNIANATTQQIPPPAAPSGLAASAASSSLQVTLTWTDNATTETGFIIERSPDGSTNWTTITTTAANANSYNDTTNLTAGTEYFYRVTATNSGGPSSPSNTASATTSTAPAAPDTLVATPLSATQVSLTWADHSSNETGFIIERSPDGLNNWTQVATPAANATGATDAGLAATTTYYYRIRAVNNIGPSTDSNVSSATTLAVPPPAAPSNLVATASTTTLQINLTWTDNSNNETGFIVERSPDGSTGWTTITTTAANATSYSNTTTLTAGTQFFYRVTATNGNSSTPSNTASATTATAPTAPSTLVATGVSATQINLTWKDNSNNETGFILERSADGVNNWTQIATPAANATSYSNTGLSPLTTYYYRIRATNGVGPSANSTVAQGQTTQSTGLPSPFVDGDIGTTGAVGSASFASSTYTVKGAGTTIGGTADSFNFVYRQWTGDGTLIARVTAVQSTNTGALAGIMFRQSLAANSAEAGLFLTPSTGAVFTQRTTAGGSTTTTTSSGISATYWLKLVRSGNTFTAYTSSNGKHWSQVGSTITISMTNPIYVGLAVSSKVSGTLNTSTFDNVSIA